MSNRQCNPLIASAVRNALRQSKPATIAVCSLALASPMFSGAAHAQESESGRALEEITVTARKRDELMSDVPVSISAISSGAIEAAGVFSMTDLFSMAPGVENNDDGSRQAYKPAIRGVGSQENASIRAKVTSFIDGVPLIGAQGIGSLAGLDHVEILRGPQSAAFGRSTFGGAINYVTQSPSNEFELKLRGTFADNDTRNLSAVLSAPILDDRLGAVVTLQENNYGGDDDWVTALGYQLGATNDKQGSIKLAFNPSDSVSGSIMYLRQEIDDSESPLQFAALSQYRAHPDNPSGQCALNGGMSSCVIVGAVNNDLVPLVFEYDYDDPANPILDPGTRYTRDRLQGALSVDFDNGYSLTALAAKTEDDGFNWLDRDAFDLAGMSTIHVVATPVSDEKYGEVRLSSPSERQFNWLIGASIYDYDYVNTVYNNYTANIVMDIFAEGAKNTGVFFNLGYDFNDRLTGSFEGRYQNDEISGTYPANPARGAPEAINTMNETKSFQPRVALTYAINDSSNVYFQAARGTNPAGFNINALDPILLQTAADEGYALSSFTAFDEEEIISYEIGLKGAALDNTLRYAAAVYYLDWTGYVQPVTGNWTPADGILLPGTTGNDYFSRLFINTGDLDGVGFEFEGTWNATDRLTIGGMLSYSGLEFTNDSCSPIPIDYGVPAVQTSPFACAGVGGNLPPMFSNFATSLDATYTFPVTSDIDGFVRLDHRYRSKRYVEQTNTDYIDGFHLLNLRVGIRGESWSAELFANNLTDDDTPTGAVRFFDGRQPGMVFGSSYVNRRPRSVGIALAYDF